MWSDPDQETDTTHAFTEQVDTADYALDQQRIHGTQRLAFTMDDDFHAQNSPLLFLRGEVGFAFFDSRKEQAWDVEGISSIRKRAESPD